MTFKPELDPRRAGRVARWHTWPHVRPQSVAEHSWQVARVLLAIWPDAPRTLLEHALFHDVGEVVTGDAPYPVKRVHPDLEKAHALAEREAHLTMIIPWSLPSPLKMAEPAEDLVFHTAHFVEMWEWALDEIAMGNVGARPVAERCLIAAEDILIATSVINPSPAWIDTAKAYIARRKAWHERTVG